MRSGDAKRTAKSAVLTVKSTPSRRGEGGGNEGEDRERTWIPQIPSGPYIVALGHGLRRGRLYSMPPKYLPARPGFPPAPIVCARSGPVVRSLRVAMLHWAKQAGQRASGMRGHKHPAQRRRLRPRNIRPVGFQIWTTLTGNFGRRGNAAETRPRRFVERLRMCGFAERAAVASRLALRTFTCGNLLADINAALCSPARACARRPSPRRT